MRDAVRRRSRTRSCGVLARMEHVGIGVDVAELRALNDRLVGRGASASSGELQRGRRARRSTSTRTPQLREILFDELGLAPAEEDQDRLLDRRRVAREAARPAPDHRAAAARTARSRSCAAPTARGCSPRSRPTAASTPRSTRPSPAPAGCQLRPAEPAQHPGAQRARAAQFRKAFVPAPGLRAAGRRLQPDRAALHRPPRRGSRA